MLNTFMINVESQVKVVSKDGDVKVRKVVEEGMNKVTLRDEIKKDW